MLVTIAFLTYHHFNSNWHLTLYLDSALPSRTLTLLVLPLQQ